MVLFAMRTGNSRDVERWLSQTIARSKEENMLRNPFNMRFKKVRTKKGLLLVFEVKPLWPNVTFFGWLIAFTLFVLLGPSFWVWPGIVLGCLGYFWTSEFFYLMSKLGIKKAGYSGEFKRVRLSKVVEEVMF